MPLIEMCNLWFAGEERSYVHKAGPKAYLGVCESWGDTRDTGIMQSYLVFRIIMDLPHNPSSAAYIADFNKNVCSSNGS